jgi:uncharacterized protein (DUF1499 family)
MLKKSIQTLVCAFCQNCVSIFADDTANAIQKLQKIVNKEKAARQEAEQKHIL